MSRKGNASKGIMFQMAFVIAILAFVLTFYYIRFYAPAIKGYTHSEAQFLAFRIASVANALSTVDRGSVTIWIGTPWHISIENTGGKRYVVVKEKGVEGKREVMADVETDGKIYGEVILIEKDESGVAIRSGGNRK